jgi:integrase
VNEKEGSSIATLRASGKLAPQTKENYILRIRAYLRRMGESPDQFIQTVSRDPKAFEEDFVRFIAEVSGSSATSTTAFWRDSLRRFLEINRVKGVDWDYVNQFIPKVRKSGLDRAPTLEEIRKVVSIADLRTKCLVLFLSSSGARIGSVEYLRWRDVQEVEFEGMKLAKVTIYKGEPEEYDTFVSPESYEYLLKYKEVREKVGEVITPSSPVFVREVNKRRFDQSKVRPVGVRTLKNQMGELLNQMKMREKLTDTKNYRSYEWKQRHSFRKFFKTKMEMSGVKPIITEMLMGHALGVARSYMKPTLAEMVEEYSKAIDNLTISMTGPVK